MAKVKIAVVSDTHCLSTVALCPNNQIPLPDGGFYSPSKSQQWLFQCWEEFWQRVGEVEADKLYIVSNGDAVEGQHHSRTQLITLDPPTQMQILRDCWDAPLSLDPDALFFVNGTETHVGQGGASEKSFASWLEGDGFPVKREPECDTPTWWRCKMTVEGNLFDFVHQGRTGLRTWTHANASNLLAADIFMRHAERGERHPDLSVRAHFHRWNDSYDAHPTRVIQLGCWQFGTYYVKQRLPEHPPGFGGIIITAEDGHYEVEKIKFEPQEVKPWRG